MKVLIPVLVAVMAVLSIPQSATAAPAPYEDIPLGSLSADSVNGALRKVLSPHGRYVIVAINSTVRVFDTPDKIADARKALEALQNAPSIVSFQIDVRTGMHEVTRQSPAADPISEYEVPVPQTYAPPQVSGQGVVPGMPGNFTTRHVDRGSGGYVNPGAYVHDGYVTGTEVRTQETGKEGGVIHRFKGATVFPKPVAVPVFGKVADPQGLHDWAVNSGAVPESEPPWTVAATDMLVTPEHADDGLLLNLTPEIVIPGGPGQAPRRIPLKTCSTTALIKQGAPASFDGFPGADPDFYRLFFGAQESTANTSALVSVTGGIEYIPQ